MSVFKSLYYHVNLKHLILPGDTISIGDLYLAGMGFFKDSYSDLTYWIEPVDQIGMILKIQQFCEKHVLFHRFRLGKVNVWWQHRGLLRQT